MLRCLVCDRFGCSECAVGWIAGPSPAMTIEIDALLFDLGRVLVDIDMTRAQKRWAELAGLPDGHFTPERTVAMMRHDIFHGHERGHVSDEVFFDHLRSELGLPLDQAQMRDGWNAIFIGEAAGVREALARVTGKLPLYVFSNTNAPHQVYWSDAYAEMLSPFAKIYTSHELGHRKPDASAFAAVCADMGVPAQRVLFFDDSPVNVTGARAFGMKAIEVASTADILAGLDAAGL